MPKLYLVRHGKAAADWGAESDPGLDAEGRRQAAAAAEHLGALGPLPIVTSPLRRTRETAVAFEQRWGITAKIDPRIAEIPSPVEGLAARAQWLAAAMQGNWRARERPQQQWRQDLLDALTDYPADTILVTHFIAINVVVGQATGDDRLVCFRPENASCTIVDVDGRTVRLVERGGEAATRIL